MTQPKESTLFIVYFSVLFCLFQAVLRVRVTVWGNGGDITIKPRGVYSSLPAFRFCTCRIFKSVTSTLDGREQGLNAQIAGLSCPRDDTHSGVANTLR